MIKSSSSTHLLNSYLVVWVSLEAISIKLITVKACIQFMVLRHLQHEIGWYVSLQHQINVLVLIKLKSWWSSYFLEYLKKRFGNKQNNYNIPLWWYYCKRNKVYWFVLFMVCSKALCYLLCYCIIICIYTPKIII